jgi:hypothetical protein
MRKVHLMRHIVGLLVFCAMLLYGGGVPPPQPTLAAEGG